jgi:arginase family enzyme
MYKVLNELVIMNFSNVYTEQTFYKHERVHWINCTDIQGADCFCDSEASQKICRRMEPLSPQGIHFIDSGNYHYISKFFTDKILEDFILVVFDHHPDMQPSLFDELLTCGSWVKAVIDTNRHLKKVVLVGISDELLKHIEPQYLSRIIEFKESQLEDLEAWQKFHTLHFNLPIYISIDKDVLSTDEEQTNWDQGKATLKELKRLLLILMKNDRLIGVDICGGCNYSINGLLDANLRKDDAVNQQLAQLCENQVKW